MSILMKNYTQKWIKVTKSCGCVYKKKKLNKIDDKMADNLGNILFGQEVLTELCALCRRKNESK